MNRFPLLLALGFGFLGQASLAAGQEPQAAAGPQPIETLAELQKLPSIAKLGGDELSEFKGLPVTAVYRRVGDDNEINYLVFRDAVIGYQFLFRHNGPNEDLWGQSLNSFLESTFPKDRFTVVELSTGTVNGTTSYRKTLVKRGAVYADAAREHLVDESTRLRNLAFGSQAPTAVEDEHGHGGNDTPPADPNSAAMAQTASYPKTIDEYLKRFPSTEKVEPVEGIIAGFSSASQDLPANGYYLLRKSESVELLVLANGQQIIGYLARITGPAGASSMWTSSVEAGLAAVFPDPVFSRRMAENLSSNLPCYIYEIRDTAAFRAAREARVAEEAAKWKALLNP